MSAPEYNGQTVPILSVDPDWSTLNMVEQYSTQVVEALTTAEQRQQKYPRCLYSLKFNAWVSDAGEQGKLRKQFDQAGAMPFGAPIWPDALTLTADAAIGETLLHVDDIVAGSAFLKMGHVILWADRDTWEVVEVESIPFSDLVVITEGLAAAWPLGTIIMPVAFGLLRRPTFESMTDEAATISFEFSERWLSISNQGQLTAPPAAPEEPEVTYETACRDTVSIEWGEQSYAVGWRVEISDSRYGPWSIYISDMAPDRTGIVFNNYFGGTKFLRVSVAIEYEYAPGDIRTYYAPFSIFTPQAPVIAPPTIGGLTGATPSSVELFTTTESALDGAQVELVSREENALIDSDNYIEIRARFERLIGASWDGIKDVLTLEHDDPGVTFAITRDGSEPTTSTPALVIDGTANNIGSYRTDFGFIVRVRACKGGCASPEIAFVVDQRRPLKGGNAFVVGAAVSSGGTCTRPKASGEVPPALGSCESYGGPDSFDEVVKVAVCALLAGHPGASSTDWIYHTTSTINNGGFNLAGFPTHSINYGLFLAGSLTFNRPSLYDAIGPAGLHTQIQLVSGIATLTDYAGTSLHGVGGTGTAVQTAGTFLVGGLTTTPCEEMGSLSFVEFYVISTIDRWPTP